jgi:molybdate transport repressor ModE-like protein/molybdopterin-binding protein
VTGRPRRVTDTDVELLRAVARERSVVAASRSVGLTRDRATYRLRRLREAFGGPVVEGRRGGSAYGTTRLTELGDRIVRGGFEALELLGSRPVAPPTRSNRLTGAYRARPAPGVELPGGARLRVTFAAEEGERVTVLLDPEAVLVARGRFASSARNVLRARVVGVGRAPGGGRTLTVRTGPVRLRVAITDEAVRQLGLAPGVAVWLYVKATAIRRVAGPGPARPTRGSRRR